MSILIKNVSPVLLSNYSENLSIRINKDGIVTEASDVLRESNEDIVLSGKDLYVSPGWIDIHTHIYYGVSNLAVDPELCGPRTGVTVLVDAGSAGEANFIGFRDYIIKPSSFPIYSFINIGSIGLVLSNKVSEIDSLDKININNLIEVINNNKEYIKGVKLRASGVLLKGAGTEIVKIAKEVAMETNLPLVVHIGEPPPLMEDVLDLLNEKDIVTHIYHGKKFNMYRNGKIHPIIDKAYNRGVIFDVGHGGASFSFDVAEKAINENYKPYSISTDIHARNIEGPVINMSDTMTKLYNLNLTLEEVIMASSINPAKILDIESFQDDLISKKARFTLFTIENKKRKYFDSLRNKRVFNKSIIPKFTIISNQIIKCEV